MLAKERWQELSDNVEKIDHGSNCTGTSSDRRRSDADNGDSDKSLEKHSSCQEHSMCACHESRVTQVMLS